MKRIALSLLTIAAVAVMATGATRAYFSDEKAVNGMTFATGTLKISDVSEDWTQTVKFEGKKPGDSIKKFITIQNTGTLPIGSLSVSANNVVDEKNFLGQLTGWAYRDMGPSGNEVQVAYNSNGSTMLSNVEFLGNGLTLEPGQKMHAIVYFQVPTTLGNDWQNTSASFDLMFHAQQVQ